MNAAQPVSPTGPDERPFLIAEVPLGSDILRVELKTFNYRRLFYAWRYFRDRGGELRPSKHGLAFAVESLPDVATAFTAALAQARAEGVLPADGAP